MIFKGRFRTVRHADHAVPSALPRPLLGAGAPLDIRAWHRPGSDLPLLLVSAPRKAGGAVRRNRFRRRSRMAFLALMEGRVPASWVVWIRPSRRGPALDRLSYRDIEHQLGLALRRLASMGDP
ncbi:MAG TPA: ribonuclease P protein component [Holophagaceae bacterium]